MKESLPAKISSPAPGTIGMDPVRKFNALFVFGFRTAVGVEDSIAVLVREHELKIGVLKVFDGVRALIQEQIPYFFDPVIDHLRLRVLLYLCQGRAVVIAFLHIKDSEHPRKNGGK